MSDVMGVVKTNKIKSDCLFYICDSEEWESMTREQQDERMIQAMWDSGMVEVSVKQETDQ